VLLVGSLLLIFLVFCVVFLVGSVLPIFLVFCVVFLVLFVFVLCLVYPILPVSLDCPFLIYFLSHLDKKQKQTAKRKTASIVPCYFDSI
jgi:hypothetical protein